MDAQGAQHDCVGARVCIYECNCACKCECELECECECECVGEVGGGKKKEEQRTREREREREKDIERAIERERERERERECVLNRARRLEHGTLPPHLNPSSNTLCTTPVEVYGLSLFGITLPKQSYSALPPG